VFHTSLGGASATLDHPVLRQVLYRAVRYLGGWREGPPVGVAMIGYGAIGFEHGQAMRATAGLDLALVCDRSPARLEAAQQAFAPVRTTTSSAEVAQDDAIGAVIVCTPPNTHAVVAAQMLEAGKHVVVEKPFCLTTREADRLIALATERQLALTVYQNRRWDPDFLAIQQLVRAGTLGDLFHLETFIGGFAHPCGFWHSHEPISGGVFYDWGSHYLDWVLTLLPDEVTSVRASAHKRVWHDVTNADQANLSIHFAGGQEATFIHSDIAAILKPKWYLLGTRGALVGNWRHETVTARAWSGDLIEEHLAPAEALPVLTVALRAEDGQIHEQRLSLPPAPPYPFHRNLANHLLAGEPLAVNPLSSRRNIAVMEAAVSSAAHGAAVAPIASEHD
jgi:predicted dehydrogenase